MTTPTNTPATCQTCDFFDIANIREYPPYITYRCENPDSPRWDDRVFYQTKACDKYKPIKPNRNEHREHDTGGAH